MYEFGFLTQHCDFAKNMSQLVFISIISGSSAIGVLILWLVIFFTYKHLKKRDSTEHNVNIEMEKRNNEEEAKVGVFLMKNLYFDLILFKFPGNDERGGRHSSLKHLLVNHSLLSLVIVKH